MVFKWIWDSEYVEVCLRNVQEFGTLQEAIVFAHQVGDTGPQAYAEKEAYEKRISQPLSETEPQAAPKILQCPLSLIVEGDFENCVEANCAWWVNSAHSQNGCAVFVMAKKIALEVE